MLIRPACLYGVVVSLGFIAFVGIPSNAIAAIEINGFGVLNQYNQNFDTTTPVNTGLVNSGTSSVLPAGWALSETGTSANTSYTAGTGSSATGDTYSFGVALANDRAFGTLLSGTLVPRIGAEFQNKTGGTITDLTIGYNGEQWRRGNARTIANLDRLDFQYSTDATSLTTGTWIDVNALDLNSTIGLSASGSLLSTTSLSTTISALSIAHDAAFWIRWLDFDIAPGADDGLAVDDFAIYAAGFSPPAAVPEVSALMVWTVLCGIVLGGSKWCRSI
jgi:hypothetical protein